MATSESEIHNAVSTIKRFQSVGEPIAVSDELLLAVEAMVDFVKDKYNTSASEYANLRGDFPSRFNIDLIERFLSASIGACEPLPSKNCRILEVGMGNGRDIRYMASKGDFDVYGTDICINFIEEAKRRMRSVSPGFAACEQADMRDLSIYEDAYFNGVRNHATLHHLPLLTGGIGIDCALAETWRVLKLGGVFCVFTKEGKGLEWVDTNEGLGERLFQLLTQEDVVATLERNGFAVIELERITTSSTDPPIDWIWALCKKEEREFSS